jgi:xylulose-5-phosphate/fructose-6-phosphate phosphoketolase
VINGYREEGTTTTPFALLAMNGVDRYHVLMQAVRAGAPGNPAVAAKADEAIHRYERKLAEHQAHVGVHGEDPEEIAAWTWSA